MKWSEAELPEKAGHLLLKFRGREAPEGWYLFFEDLQWGPFASRDEVVALANEMVGAISQQFDIPVAEKKTVERRDKELMPWVKPRRGKNRS